MILNGNNLGERHRDLNLKVSDAVAKQINFEELESQPEKCDVDKLFKIDLASQYKNIDYILEVLKCGDVFYISRALKCLWMYTDEYSQFINTDYLEANIFPNMSMKMKKKTLTSISMHMRNADRAIGFYKYCVDGKLNNYAVKFLLFTPDCFKLNLIKTKQITSFPHLKLLKQFIGTSFELANAYLEVHNFSSSTIYELRFLYSQSEEYLNILKHIENSATHPHVPRRFGIRMSKSILKKHKHSVLNNPVLYVNILNEEMLKKHLTTGDIKILALGLLPDNSRDYWTLNFYNTYKFILDKIPTNELFTFMKQIYVAKYDDDEFEMSIEFYTLGYYEMFTIDEQESWALQHIERDEEIPGIKNYMWYKFVSFHKAFPGIKRYVSLIPDKDEIERIVNVLPETAKNQDEINKILNYYYERHLNESESQTASFIDKIIEVHDIYSFNNECWPIFDKLLCSLEAYTATLNVTSDYMFRSLVYHILHDMELPKALKETVDNFQPSRYMTATQQLTEERKRIVGKYLLNVCGEKIKSLMCHPDYNIENENDKDRKRIRKEIQQQIYKINPIIYCFNRTAEDCSDFVVQFLDSNKETEKAIFEKKNEEDFVRWLKKDIKMAVNGISEIRCNTYRWNFRLCRLFRKLKVYFSNDVAKEYLDYFMEYLSDVPEGPWEYRNIKMAVVGVFYLANRDSIMCFLEKNVPISAKIYQMYIDNPVLQVQKAICRLFYHTQPALPLSIIQKYAVGDYLHFCQQVIYSYFVNYPSSTKFVDHLIDAPLSIQKHGLRLAFSSYNVKTLTPLIKAAWNKTKNVSLRMVLFEALFERLLKESHEVQQKLYEVLKLYTSELNHEHHVNVYFLLVSDSFPDAFKGDFIETSWLTVSKLSDKSIDIQRKISVIRHMEKCIYLVKRDFVRVQIIDEHVKYILCEKHINEDWDKPECQQLNNAKWQLTAKYIMSFSDEMEQQKSLQLLETIMTECLQSWSLVKHKTYAVRKFIDEFITIIMDKDPKTIESCANTVPIYHYIRSILRSFLKKEEIYLLNWKLKLSIICRNLIHGMIKNNGDMDYMEIFHAYGKIVANIIIHSVKNNEFYHCFYESIAKIINDVRCTMCDILRIDYNGFVYYVCESLTETTLPETHQIALFMLPKEPEPDFDSEDECIITHIKEKSLSHEIQCTLYDKYVLSDYFERPYIS